MSEKIEIRQFNTKKRREIPIKIDDRDYVLKQPNAAVEVEYRNAKDRCISRDTDGKPVKVDGMASTDILIVARCLFMVESNGNHLPVSEEWVKQQDPDLYKDLYKTLQEEFDVDDKKRTVAKKEEKDKNPPSGSIQP